MILWTRKTSNNKPWIAREEAMPKPSVNLVAEVGLLLALSASLMPIVSIVWRSVRPSESRLWNHALWGCLHVGNNARSICSACYPTRAIARPTSDHMDHVRGYKSVLGRGCGARTLTSTSRPESNLPSMRAFRVDSVQQYPPWCCEGLKSALCGFRPTRAPGGGGGGFHWSGVRQICPCLICCLWWAFALRATRKDVQVARLTLPTQSWPGFEIQSPLRKKKTVHSRPLPPLLPPPPAPSDPSEAPPNGVSEEVQSTTCKYFWNTPHILFTLTYPRKNIFLRRYTLFPILSFCHLFFSCLWSAKQKHCFCFIFAVRYQNIMQYSITKSHFTDPWTSNFGTDQHVRLGLFYVAWYGLMCALLTTDRSRLILYRFPSLITTPKWNTFDMTQTSVSNCGNYAQKLRSLSFKTFTFFHYSYNSITFACGDPSDTKMILYETEPQSTFERKLYAPNLSAPKSD